MTSEPIRPALLQSIQAIEAEAATEILRMLTSDRVEPTLRCHADGADAVVNCRPTRLQPEETAMWL